MGKVIKRKYGDVLKYPNIENPMVKYKNGFGHKDKDGNFVPHYDEDLCFLHKTIGDDEIFIVKHLFAYALVINGKCNKVSKGDLGAVIMDVVDTDDTSALINKINTYSDYWVEEVVKADGKQLKTIDYDSKATKVFGDEVEFVESIRQDVGLFHTEYPYHELIDMKVFEHNSQCFSLSLLLDDCDVEQHISYIVYKDDIERIIKEFKKVFGVSVVNYTDEPLLKVI